MQNESDWLMRQTTCVAILQITTHDVWKGLSNLCCDNAVTALSSHKTTS